MSVPSQSDRVISNERRVPNEFYLLAATSLLTWLPYETMQPILPLYITQLGATKFELGLIVSLLSFVAIAAKLPLGLLAERVGNWRIISAVAIGQAISLLLYSIVEDIQWFYPIRIVHALVLAAFIPAGLSITLELAPSRKRGEIMGRFLTAIGMGSMLGPFLCTFLLNHVNYVYLFRIVSIIPLLGLTPLLLISRKVSRTDPLREKSKGFLAFLKGTAHSRNMLILSYLRLIFSFTNAFFLTLFALHAEDSLLLLPSIIAFLFGVKGTVGMLSRIPSGRFADKVGCRWPIFLAFTLLTFVYYILSIAETIYLLTFAMGIYGLAHGMRAVSEWSLLGEFTSTETRNLTIAYLSTMFDVGAAIGGVVAGVLCMSMDIDTIFRLASIIILTGCFTIPLIRTKLRTVRAELCPVTQVSGKSGMTHI